MSILRDLDLIIFGATGFTGRLAAEYVAKNFPPGMSWAISGRNQKRLEELSKDLAKFPNPPKIQAVIDHSNKNRVFDWVRRARVILTCAGPFARYGENLVAACAELGTHYLDITGETVWVHQMIQKYEKAAQVSGAILIPFSGFDSIPSDLGVWKVLEDARAKSPNQKITKVISLFSVKGGLNGGSFETFLDLMEMDQKKKKLYDDSSLLVPGELKKKFRFSDQKLPVYVKEAKVTAPPFFMGPINSRVVYRSQALRMSRLGEQDQKPVEYVELHKISSRNSQFKSWSSVLSWGVVSQVGHSSLGRKLLRKFGPKAGQGPSEEERNSGYSRAQFYAYHNDQLVSQIGLSFQGDPGNKTTVILLCESARCLLFKSEELSKISGGFWTPTTALGRMRCIHLFKVQSRSQLWVGARNISILSLFFPRFFRLSRISPPHKWERIAGVLCSSSSTRDGKKEKK